MQQQLTPEQALIKKAISNLKKTKGDKTKIIVHYNGFIILAQSDADLNNKKARINKGDTDGFYHINDFK